MAEEADVVVLVPGLTYDEARFLNDCDRRSRPYRQLRRYGKAVADSLVKHGLLSRRLHGGSETVDLTTGSSNKDRQYDDLTVTMFGLRVAQEFAKRGYYGKHLMKYTSSVCTKRSNKW